jgi:hypothetical protein
LVHDLRLLVLSALLLQPLAPILLLLLRLLIPLLLKLPNLPAHAQVLTVALRQVLPELLALQLPLLALHLLLGVPPPPGAADS